MNKCTRASTVFYKICCDNKFVCLFHKQNFGHTIYYTFQFQRKYFFSHKNWQMLFSFAKLKKNTKMYCCCCLLLKKTKISGKWKVEEKNKEREKKWRRWKLLSAAWCVVMCISTVKLKVKFYHPISFLLSTWANLSKKNFLI